MFPHERSLVKRMEGKPFALIGINSDRDREQLKNEVLPKENITWRSFWNGGSTDGPISRAWNVHGWPTIYVLDATGKIRFKNKREKDLDVAVDSLLKEMGVSVEPAKHEEPAEEPAVKPNEKPAQKTSPAKPKSSQD
jgi:hypothetical protein